MQTDQLDLENSQIRDFERIRVLFTNMKSGYLGVLTGTVLLYTTVATYSSSRAANLWLLAMLLVNIPRIVISIQFERGVNAGRITPATVAPWEKRLTLSFLPTYLCTVAAIFLPYGEHEIVATLLCALVFTLMAAGGVLMLTTSLPSIFMFLSLMMLAVIIKMLQLSELMFNVAALCLALGYVQLVRLILIQNRLLMENITLKIQHGQYALVDPLTSLANRRQLQVVIEKLLPTVKRGGEPFSLIMLDLDHFKLFNDTHGHSAGDELLVKVARILADCSRQQDLVVRYGGEEFLVVLPRTGEREAMVITERIRDAVKAQTDVTVSGGIAEYANENNFDVLLQRADAALYLAKQNGRDKCMISSEMPGQYNSDEGSKHANFRTV